MNAIQIAIDALLKEQGQREEIIQTLIQLNNGLSPKLNGHAPRKKPARRADPAVRPQNRFSPTGPMGQILTLLTKHGAMSRPELIQRGLRPNVVHGSLKALMDKKLVKVSGKPKHFVYALA